MNANELAKKFVAENFSQETTHNEAIGFIAGCPFRKSAALMMVVYLGMVSQGMKPYQALEIITEAFIDAVEQTTKGMSNEN